MSLGSLFSGIGGLELGLEQAGLGPVTWQVESDTFARDVLARHWPEAHRHYDVRTFCAPLMELPAVGVVCGGFPCQDLSVAGRGAGIDEGARSGLWREMVRIVDECQPEVVVVENVAQGLSRWQPRVEGDLSELGYIPATVIVPASAVGAPHRRARAFCVADTHGLFLRFVQQRGSGGPSERVRDEGQAEPLDDGGLWDASGSSAWSALPRVGGVGDGLLGGVDAARQRADRLRVLGNAVVPAVAYAVGLAIMQSRTWRIPTSAQTDG